MPEPMQASVTDVMNEMSTRVQSIAEFNKKLVWIYNPSDALDKLKGVKPPYAAIVYEGMRSVGSEGPSAKVGISAEMVVSIYVFQQAPTNFNGDEKTNTVDLLSQLRSNISGQRSVTGHFWKFLVEAPGELVNNMALWIQRWSVPIQIRPTSSSPYMLP